MLQIIKAFEYNHIYYAFRCLYTLHINTVNTLPRFRSIRLCFGPRLYIRANLIRGDLQEEIENYPWGLVWRGLGAQTRGSGLKPLVLQPNVELAEQAVTTAAGAPFMASTSQAPETARKALLIALAVAVTSPTKEQTEGAFRVMHLKHNYCLSMEIVLIKHRWDVFFSSAKQFIEHNW